MPTLAHFEALSFDCYGTLIDWETGIVSPPVDGRPDWTFPTLAAFADAVDSEAVA
jgi:FMN phosphatase YigB (HAD superfamily)